ncbi:hypothetical protein K469DRAFT_753193 [Zopfia rhizophila CBS 207.26]|uniref:Uncharacterized protein n=1 Tax=Zopfia rhizophila CBS 207.26 TaxID=1314779 RepID=A0A6A6DLS5_9PEZI|nr:hypothetical protein K469DRAFT_753193 [Zopfia rhizophila CBS 207.26]
MRIANLSVLVALSSLSVGAFANDQSGVEIANAARDIVGNGIEDAVLEARGRSKPKTQSPPKTQAPPPPASSKAAPPPASSKVAPPPASSKAAPPPASSKPPASSAAPPSSKPASSSVKSFSASSSAKLSSTSSSARSSSASSSASSSKTGSVSSTGSASTGSNSSTGSAKSTGSVSLTGSASTGSASSTGSATSTGSVSSTGSVPTGSASSTGSATSTGSLSSSSSMSSTSSSTTSTSTTNCAAIGARDTVGFEVQKRDFRETLQSRRIEKRAPKSGIACDGIAKTIMQSFNYPSAGPHEAVSYGWNVIDSCDDYGWGRAYYAEGKYDTEHILEWSVITNFFTTMNSHPDFKNGFEHPDPEKNGENVNFCTYWKESWDWPDSQKMGTPDSNAMDVDGVQYTPFQWIASEYPWKQGQQEKYVDELVLLQKKINSPAKNNMFDPKDPIYNDSEMKDMIEGKHKDKKYGTALEQPREAIQRLRAVVGAFKYMQESKIKEIFVEEKNRIGKMIGNLDTALPNNPRKIKGGRNSNERTYKPWKALHLEDKWAKYMDNTFEAAKDKGHEVAHRET